MLSYVKVFSFLLVVSFVQISPAQTLPQGVTLSDIFSPFPGQRVTALLGFVDFRDVRGEVVPFQSIIAGGLASEISRYNAPPGFPLVPDSIVAFDSIPSSDFSRVSLQRFPGRYVRQMAFDTAAINPDFFAVGKSGIVARYSQNRTTSIFAPFPGVDAKSIAVDSIGRPIVGGKNKTIVRYNRNGQIGLTFQDFAPIAMQNNNSYVNVVNALAIDLNGRIIAVGKDGLVIRYLPNGQIDRIYQSFPGIVARGVVVDTLNRAYVCGDRGVVVRYSENGNIESQFQRFPGLIARALVFLPYFDPDNFPPNRPVLVVVGNSGSVVTYANNGRILPTITFPFEEEFPSGVDTIVSNIGSFVGIRATSIALLGFTFAVGGNRGIVNGSMQQYSLNADTQLLTPLIFDITNENLGICSEGLAEVTVPAGIINIIGASGVKGSIISLFSNGSFLKSIIDTSSGEWSISHLFTPGIYRLEVVMFYPQGNFRTNATRLSFSGQDISFDNFVNLIVVPQCP